MPKNNKDQNNNPNIEELSRKVDQLEKTQNESLKLFSKTFDITKSLTLNAIKLTSKTLSFAKDQIRPAIDALSDDYQIDKQSLMTTALSKKLGGPLGGHIASKLISSYVPHIREGISNIRERIRNAREDFSNGYNSVALDSDMETDAMFEEMDRQRSGKSGSSNKKANKKTSSKSSGGSSNNKINHQSGGSSNNKINHQSGGSSNNKINHQSGGSSINKINHQSGGSSNNKINRLNSNINSVSKSISSGGSTSSNNLKNGSDVNVSVLRNNQKIGNANSNENANQNSSNINNNFSDHIKHSKKIKSQAQPIYINVVIPEEKYYSKVSGNKKNSGSNSKTFNNTITTATPTSTGYTFPSVKENYALVPVSSSGSSTRVNNYPAVSGGSTRVNNYPAISGGSSRVNNYPAISGGSTGVSYRPVPIVSPGLVTGQTSLAPTGSNNQNKSSLNKPNQVKDPNTVTTTVQYKPNADGKFSNQTMIERGTIGTRTQSASYSGSHVGYESMMVSLMKKQTDMTYDMMSLLGGKDRTRWVMFVETVHNMKEEWIRNNKAVYSIFHTLKTSLFTFPKFLITKAISMVWGKRKNNYMHELGHLPENPFGALVHIGRYTFAKLAALTDIMNEMYKQTPGYNRNIKISNYSFMDQLRETHPQLFDKQKQKDALKHIKTTVSNDMTTAKNWLYDKYSKLKDKYKNRKRVLTPDMVYDSRPMTNNRTNDNSNNNVMDAEYTIIDPNDISNVQSIINNKRKKRKIDLRNKKGNQNISNIHDIIDTIIEPNDISNVQSIINNKRKKRRLDLRNKKGNQNISNIHDIIDVVLLENGEYGATTDNTVRSRHIDMRKRRERKSLQPVSTNLPAIINSNNNNNLSHINKRTGEVAIYQNKSQMAKAKLIQNKYNNSERERLLHLFKIIKQMQENTRRSADNSTMLNKLWKKGRGFFDHIFTFLQSMFPLLFSAISKVGSFLGDKAKSAINGAKGLAGLIAGKGIFSKVRNIFKKSPKLPKLPAGQQTTGALATTGSKGKKLLSFAKKIPLGKKALISGAIAAGLYGVGKWRAKESEKEILEKVGGEKFAELASDKTHYLDDGSKLIGTHALSIKDKVNKGTNWISNKINNIDKDQYLQELKLNPTEEKEFRIALIDKLSKLHNTPKKYYKEIPTEKLKEMWKKTNYEATANDFVKGKLEGLNDIKYKGKNLSSREKDNASQLKRSYEMQDQGEAKKKLNWENVKEYGKEKLNDHQIKKMNDEIYQYKIHESNKLSSIENAKMANTGLGFLAKTVSNKILKSLPAAGGVAKDAMSATSNVAIQSADDVAAKAAAAAAAKAAAKKAAIKGTIGLGAAVVAKKIIPFVGTVLSLISAYKRYTDGDKIGAVIDVVAAIGSAIPGVGTLISAAATGTNAFRDYNKVKKGVEDIKNKHMGNMDKKKQEDIMAIKSVMVPSLFKKVESSLMSSRNPMDVFQNLKSSGSIFWDKDIGRWQGSSDALMPSTMDNIKDKGGRIIENVINKVSDIGKNIKDSVTKKGKELYDIHDNYNKNIDIMDEAKWMLLRRSIKKSFRDFKNKVKEIKDDIVKNIKEGFNEWKEGIIGGIRWLIRGTKKLFNQWKDGMIGGIRYIIDGFKGWFKEKLGFIGDWFRDMGKGISKWVHELIEGDSWIGVLWRKTEWIRDKISEFKQVVSDVRVNYIEPFINESWELITSIPKGYNKIKNYVKNWFNNTITENNNDAIKSMKDMMSDEAWKLYGKDITESSQPGILFNRIRDAGLITEVNDQYVLRDEKYIKDNQAAMATMKKYAANAYKEMSAKFTKAEIEKQKAIEKQREDMKKAVLKKYEEICDSKLWNKIKEKMALAQNPEEAWKQLESTGDIILDTTKNKWISTKEDIKAGFDDAMLFLLDKDYRKKNMASLSKKLNEVKEDIPKKVDQAQQNISTTVQAKYGDKAAAGVNNAVDTAQAVAKDAISYTGDLVSDLKSQYNNFSTSIRTGFNNMVTAIKKGNEYLENLYKMQKIEFQNKYKNSNDLINNFQGDFNSDKKTGVSSNYKDVGDDLNTKDTQKEKINFKFDPNKMPSFLKLENKGINYGGVNPAFRERFENMAYEYKQLTGKDILVTSGYRSIEQQMDLYNRKPTLAAPPGRSLHNFGFAMDINSPNANELASSGLLNKYGFHRPALRPNGAEAWHIQLQEPDKVGFDWRSQMKVPAAFSKIVKDPRTVGYSPITKVETGFSGVNPQNMSMNSNQVGNSITDIMNFLNINKGNNFTEDQSEESGDGEVLNTNPFKNLINQLKTSGHNINNAINQTDISANKNMLNDISKTIKDGFNNVMKNNEPTTNKINSSNVSSNTTTNSTSNIVNDMRRPAMFEDFKSFC